MGGCLCISGLHSDDVIIPWDPTKRDDYVAQSFIEFQAVIRVVRALDRLLAVLVPKLWQTSEN